MGYESCRCSKTSTPGIFIVTPSLQGCSTRLKRHLLPMREITNILILGTSFSENSRTYIDYENGQLRFLVEPNQHHQRESKETTNWISCIY